jgi:hypothetical protein
VREGVLCDVVEEEDCIEIFEVLLLVPDRRRRSEGVDEFQFEEEAIFELNSFAEGVEF